MAIKRLLIANRGEIAVRIINAAKKLGITTIQVHSDVDIDSLAVKRADIAVEIGPAQASKSYLNQDVLLKVAKENKADAIHPGYGFLAENHQFARLVEKNDLIFVGPKSQTIKEMGNKVLAIKRAEKAGVPTIPHTEGLSSDIQHILKEAENIGYPVMIKASAGGGGRGIRIAHNQKELMNFVPQSAIEAKNAFGDDTLYLERVIKNARHIEVQIIGDGENVIHLFERDCSIQRRRQKIWEEAPSIILSERVRQKLCQVSVALAKSVNYAGAGTIEYLYDEGTQQFYFLEMNTRIQVEHPITEEITGIDIVEQMLKIASGEPLSIDQQDVKIKGHSIELRITAEDAENQFFPSPGRITNLTLSEDDHCRFDHMLYQGYEVLPFYDSLLGKLIVKAQDRKTVIKKLKKILDEIKIEGIKTTLPLFKKLVNEQDIEDAKFNTNWLNEFLNNTNN